MSTLNDEDRENLAAYLDGELDEKTSQALEAKLNRDPDARKEVEALRQAWSMLDFLPRPEPSPNFTHQTMQRLTMAVPRAAPTAKMRPVRPARWPLTLAWAGAVLLALTLGAVAGHFLWFVPEPDPIADLLAHHARVVDHLALYELLIDFEFLKKLDQPDLFREETLADEPDYKPCVPPVPNEKQQRFQARAFLELPSERREQLINLDRELFAESELRRERLLVVACRYREWFDHLGVKEQEKVMQKPDRDGRVIVVKELRHLQRTWDQGARYLKLVMKDMKQDVQEYYKWYLKPWLKKDEIERLDNTEGPQFLRTLVELADRHPPALDGLKEWKDVPKDIKDKLGVKGKLPKLIKGKEHHPFVGMEVTELALKKKVKLPNELWPTSDECLSPAMQEFVRKTLFDRLNMQERETLFKAIGKWPDYPYAIRDLAKAHKLLPPWQTLPGPRERWESYRSH